jgi:acyl-CoA synthetase (AMP-forming)/AMP-acid ligase II
MHMGHLLTRAALRWPERPAWLQNERVITFRQAEARVNRLAHALAQLGATPGDRIGMLLPNCSQGLGYPGAHEGRDGRGAHEHPAAPG